MPESEAGQASQPGLLLLWRERSRKVLRAPTHLSPCWRITHGRSEDEPNLNQIMETVLEDGYLYAQGYVEGADEGDMRIFLLDGELIEVDGHISAFRRVPDGNDPRANICAGGRMASGDITDKQRAVVKAMHDKLVQDGMFFVGIDVIGDKVIEINTESPGGLQGIEHLYGIDICPVVIDALERRTQN